MRYWTVTESCHVFSQDNDTARFTDDSLFPVIVFNLGLFTNKEKARQKAEALNKDTGSPHDKFDILEIKINER